MIPQIADFDVEPIIRDGRVVDFNVHPLPDILRELPDPIAARITPEED